MVYTLLLTPTVLLKVPLAIVPRRLMPEVKPPIDAEGSCGCGATSLVPHVKPPVVAEGSCGYWSHIVTATREATRCC